MTRAEMILNCGFNKDVSGVVMEGLMKKSTKANQEVINQINKSSFYKVLASDTQFTIHSEFHINKYEYKKIESILKLAYIKVGTMIEKNGLWNEWIEQK